MWLPEAERVHVIPAVIQVMSITFKTGGFACQCHLAVDLKPVFFMARLNLAHPSAYSVHNASLAFEGCVDFEEAIIQRPFMFIKQDFDNTKAFIDRIEQRAVFLFRHARYL